jgi:hypothetical protein
MWVVQSELCRENARYVEEKEKKLTGSTSYEEILHQIQKIKKTPFAAVHIVLLPVSSIQLLKGKSSRCPEHPPS